jgi:hypothetical protein
MDKTVQGIDYGSQELLLLEAQLYWHIRPMELDGLRLQIRQPHYSAGIVKYIPLHMAKIQQEIDYGSLELLVAQLYWHIRPMELQVGLLLPIRKPICLAGMLQ